MKATPSPRPWRLRPALTEHRTPIIEDRKFTGVCYLAINRRIEDKGPSDQEKANAEHIIMAVNMHDELVAALRLVAELSLNALDHAHPRNSASISAIANAATTVLKEKT